MGDYALGEVTNPVDKSCDSAVVQMIWIWTNVPTSSAQQGVLYACDNTVNIYTKRWKHGFNLWYKCVAESTCDYRSHIALNYRFCKIYQDDFLPKINDGMEK